MQRSTAQTDSAPFIEFMLRMIFDAIPRAHSEAQSRAQSNDTLLDKPYSRLQKYRLTEKGKAKLD